LFPTSKFGISTDAVYHSTKKENLEGILKSGLVPHESFDYCKGFYKLIFGSVDLNRLWEFDNNVVLKINGKNYQWFKDTNLYRCKWSVCTNERIDPKDIEIIETKL